MNSSDEEARKLTKSSNVFHAAIAKGLRLLMKLYREGTHSACQTKEYGTEKIHLGCTRLSGFIGSDDP